jgi:hypothetical protein
VRVSVLYYLRFGCGSCSSVHGGVVRKQNGCKRDGTLTQEDAYLGDLLTNAKKVTVSVLYWYEKLSDLTIEIFKLILKRIKSFFVFFSIINARARWTCPTKEQQQQQSKANNGGSTTSLRAISWIGGGPAQQHSQPHHHIIHLHRPHIHISIR